MLMYALIGLSLVLTGIAGLQFTYMFYIERVYRERQKYIRTLERRYARLSERLAAAERRVDEQNALLETIQPGLSTADEAWADVIEEL